MSVQCSRPSDKKSSRPYITDSEVKLWLVEFVSMLQFLRDCTAKDISGATKGKLLPLLVFPFIRGDEEGDE